MGLNLGTLLREARKETPEKLAVIDGKNRLSYEELDREASKFAAVLKGLGVESGENVAMLLPNSRFFPICYYGILYHGCTVVPLNPLLKSEEIEYHLDDSDSVAFVTLDVFAHNLVGDMNPPGHVRHLVGVELGDAPPPKGWKSFRDLMAAADPNWETVQTDAGDTAVIIYTSGTTGRPKGAELTHFNLFSNALISSIDAFKITEEDNVLGVLPFFHSFGQTAVMNSTILNRATMEVIPRFEAEAALMAIEKNKHTVFMGVPTMYYFMVEMQREKRFDLSSLRFCFTGGAPMPVEVLKEVDELFETELLEGYGLSETSPIACCNKERRPRKPGSIGVPLWGIEIKIFDDEDREVPRGERGELVMRGHNVMKGYYKRPEATAECMRNGWFHTEDVAYMDEDGYVFIVDRTKDLIIRGGYNVYPREVEEVLYTLDGVSEAAVVGIPHPAFGEEIVAYLSPCDGIGVTEEEVINFCKQRMAAYKYPRKVEFLAQLPKGPTGKILKRELRNLAAESSQKVSPKSSEDKEAR